MATDAGCLLGLASGSGPATDFTLFLFLICSQSNGFTRTRKSEREKINVEIYLYTCVCVCAAVFDLYSRIKGMYTVCLTSVWEHLLLVYLRIKEKKLVKDESQDIDRAINQSLEKSKIIFHRFEGVQRPCVSLWRRELSSSYFGNQN